MQWKNKSHLLLTQAQKVSIILLYSKGGKSEIQENNQIKVYSQSP